MNAYTRFLVLGLLVLFAGCATTVEISKDVNYDYNINFDFTKLKTYDLSLTPKTVKIEYLMMERIKTAIDAQLQAKNLRKTSLNPDFIVQILGYQSKIYTTSWRQPGAGLTVDKGKLTLQFVDPQTNRVIWWGETQAILDPDTKPADETKMVNDAVHRILQKFPPESS